jgi:hypothetical protein
MAIALEYLSVVVPIRKIDECEVTAGFHRFLQSDRFSESGPRWHDEFLFREGAMNPMDIEQIAAAWKNRGLKPTGRRKGGLYWKDLCVVDYFNGPTLPCDWIEVDLAGHWAWLRGAVKGVTRGPGRCGE